METLYNHILVPVDFTEKNQAAITAAIQLARPGGTRVSLLHVIEFIDFPDDDEMSSFYEKLEKRSETELDNLLSLFANDDIDVTVDTVVNNRSKGIVLYAVDNDVDLIVMSSHPLDPEKRSLGWATISYQVSVLCHCSIMLVKQPVSATSTSTT
jgi:nucleotide-binding universal stress UspA family protein